jgi:hypothetical protein
VYTEHLAPPLLVCKKPAGVVANRDNSSPLGTLRYRALTQVCKQVRTEYRPIWLRQSCFRMDLSALASFIETYYPKVTDYQNAPTLLLISWDHGHIAGEFEGDYDADSDIYVEPMEDVVSEITLLISLRAHCPTFTAKFVSRPILESDVQNLHCHDCGHSIHCGCDADCGHEGAWDEAHWQMEVSYSYLQGLNVFLANSNEYWLKMMRNAVRADVVVEFTFDVNVQNTTFYIRFSKGRAPKGFQPKNMYSYALAFLNRSGMLDLKHYEELEYVIGEETGKFTRHPEQYRPGPTYNQIYLDGPTIVQWIKEKEAKASAS